jgi:phospholipid/cholesterol/gamma-HCH transport system substrate-binding protein
VQTIRDTLHSVDRLLVSNQTVMKDALLSFETYTATLANSGGAIDSALGKANTAFAGFDSVLAKIDDVIPGLAEGSDGELFQKLKSMRELADSFNKRSGAFMEEGRRSLVDISQAAVKVTRKFDSQAGGDNPPPPRQPAARRQ